MEEDRFALYNEEGVGNGVKVPRTGFIIPYFALALGSSEPLINALWFNLPPKYRSEARAIELRQSEHIKALCVEGRALGHISFSTSPITPYTVLLAEIRGLRGSRLCTGRFIINEYTRDHNWFYWNNNTGWFNFTGDAFERSANAISDTALLFNRLVDLFSRKHGVIVKAKADIWTDAGVSFFWPHDSKVKLRFGSTAAINVTYYLGEVFQERFNRSFETLGKYQYEREWVANADGRWKDQKIEYPSKEDWLTGMERSIDRLIGNNTGPFRDASPERH